MATTSSDARKLLFRSNPIPMFLYDGGSLRICGANDAALTSYGYTCGELRSMTVCDLDPSGQEPTLDRALHLDSESPALSLCCTHAAKDGKLFPVELQVVPFHRGHHRRILLMFAVDASASSEARLKIVRSEEIHRSLVEECPYGIFRLNLATSRFEQANPVLLRTIGYTIEELSSIGIPSLYAKPGDRDRFLSELYSTGKVPNFETHFRKKDGSTIHVTLSGYLCTDSGAGYQYIQGYALDITRQRQLEEELSQTHRMETVGRLAGGVAHDFNNITQSISLSCELALHNPLPPAIESKFLDVMQQTARAAEITRQLLDFSRSQLLQPRVVNINDCVRKTLPMLTRAAGVEVSVELNLDETVDHVFIDPEQLALVLMHLAENARNAMPHGGQLRISTAGYSGSQNPDFQPCAILTVSDTGVGMSEMKLARIFEPFFSTKNTSLSSGLGLSIVHGIIAQSKGRIECQSDPGQGTTFRIYLPVAADKPAAAASRCRDSNGFHVLLAEDDPVVNKHLTNSLRKAGFAVDPVGDGKEALTAFQRHSYNLVITDIVMPRLGGVELAARLRQLVPSLPVLLISGSNAEGSVVQHLPSDRIAYLQKPFASSQLVATAYELLSGVKTVDGHLCP
jgi:PAS domain S-box-containing protein